MKKFCLLISIFLIVTAAGCTHNLDTPGTNTDKEASPVSDFEYEENEEGGITITSYIGTNTNIVIPTKIEKKPVTKIGMFAFCYDHTIVSIEIPSFVTEIEDSAFTGCHSLSTVVLPQELKTIGFHAFENCANLSTVTLPNSLTAIGADAFKNCFSLKRINIPKSITSINQSFLNSGLEVIEFEEGIRTIGYLAFAYTNINTVVLPKSVKEISSWAFAGCANLESIKLNEGLISIGNEAFSDNLKLKEIIIPASVKEIGEDPFAGCQTLQTIKFEDSALENTSSLANWKYHKNEENSMVKSTPDFEYIKNEDGNVIITKYIGTDQRVVIPAEIENQKVIQITSCAFQYNHTVTSVVMPDSIISIDGQAFADCHALSSVTLSQKLESIGYGVFENCANLSEIVFPSTLDSIGANAFRNCASLKKIKIPKSITECGAESFSNSGLETIEFEEGIHIIGKLAFAYTNINTVMLPKSVKEISDLAFAGCGNLEAITLKEGLNKIRSGAFRDNPKLTEIIIPSSVTKIDEESFTGCKTLHAVKFEGNAPENYQTEIYAPLENPLPNANYTIYYHEGATGFTSPKWCGYPTEIW